MCRHLLSQTPAANAELTVSLLRVFANQAADLSHFSKNEDDFDLINSVPAFGPIIINTV
jgi:hypothetical protein